MQPLRLHPPAPAFHFFKVAIDQGNPAGAVKWYSGDRTDKSLKLPVSVHASISEIPQMKTYPAVVERDADTGLYVGWVPGFPGAHSQGETLDELHGNLQEVIDLLLQDGDVPTESEFVGVQHIRVGSR